MKNEIGNWKEFEFKKVFSFERGKRLIRINQLPGEIAYISSSKQNNGIDNYISPPSFMKIYENVLTLNNSGSVGYCFYHNYKIVCSDHCTVISIKDKKMKLNSYIALFLKPIIESIKEKYNFAREISDSRLKKEKIILPQDKLGNPDWSYMEQFSKSLSKKISFEREVIKPNTLKLNLKNMKEFDLKVLFNVRGSKKSFTQYEISQGDYLYITTTNKNNGVMSTSQVFTEERGVITIDSATDGKAFYQEKKFVGSDHVEVLEPIGFNLNRFSAMYFVSILNFQLYRYGYGRKRAQKRIQEEKVLLPYIIINQEQVPDFELIEKYIKSLPYSKSLEN